MGETEQPPTDSDQFEPVERLKLDLKNPRAPDEQFSAQDEALEYLLNFVDLNELIQSILGSGWLDYEPLIVLGTETSFWRATGAWQHCGSSGSRSCAAA